MAKIRHILIYNFRAIEKLEWYPGPGVNCIIGPGDSGKSTIIDAIDLALGPRQSKLFSDADFHKLNTEEPIRIEITVGDLADPLQNYEKYDLFLRGFNLAEERIEDEPGSGLETALTVCLQIGNDLDPVWSLYSDRASKQGREKNLSWGDRILLSGTRIGSVADYHLSWRKGAVLHRLGDEKPNTTSAIADAKRAAQKAFGEGTQPDLGDVLDAVSDTANALGVPINGNLQALLNAHSISLSGGTISLHDKDGLPLSSLGLGSSRLLVAGLLDKAKIGSNIILVDELEYGLEPHRIIRFLGAIGAKDNSDKTQSFVTSHSPVVLRELDAAQLYRMTPRDKGYSIARADIDENSQGILRVHPEAFLAKSIVLCEGASEVGLLRGFDHHFFEKDCSSIWAKGTTLVDVGGVSKLYKGAQTLQALGYRVASFRDDDAPPDLDAEDAFASRDGVVFKWALGVKIEAAIIGAATDQLVAKIMDAGAKFVGEEIASDQIKSVSENQRDFVTLRARAVAGELSPDDRTWLIQACTTKKNSWFKTVGRMEVLAQDVLAPGLDDLDQQFRSIVEGIFSWARNG